MTRGRNVLQITVSWARTPHRSGRRYVMKYAIRQAIANAAHLGSPKGHQGSMKKAIPINTPPIVMHLKKRRLVAFRHDITPVVLCQVHNYGDLLFGVTSVLQLDPSLEEGLDLLRRQWCAEPSVHGGKGTRNPWIGDSFRGS